jgi:hypothetical protein
MGQYHHPVCIEAEEGLDPAYMDSGLKEGEQGFNRPSTPSAIVALVCARGGNMPADCSQSPLIGRWAGKRVLIQGDYAEDKDIPGWKGPRLSKLYRAMRPVEERKPKKDWRTTPVFTDITREACAFLEAACNVRYFERPVRVVRRLDVACVQAQKTPWQACQGVGGIGFLKSSVGLLRRKAGFQFSCVACPNSVQRKTPQSTDQGVQASGCCRLFGDDLFQGPMVSEGPALSGWDLSGGHRGLDLPPRAMGRKTNHGIPNPSAGAAGLAGRVRIRRRADRYSPSGRRAPRQ